MIDSELKSLVSLFDDSDEPVITAVNERMIERGVGVLADLSVILRNEKSIEAKNYISERINYLTREFTMERLDKQASMDFPDLTDGIFLISKLVTPDLSREYFDDLLIPLTDDMLKEIHEEHTAMERVRIFNHIFYKRLLFKCGNYPPTRESTTLIPNILESRHGTSIAIALIYFLLARNAGIGLHPLCFQGGLTPAYVENEKVLFYVDVFHEGEIFSESRLRQFLEAQGIEVENTIFEVREDKVLMVIYLETLNFLYSSHNGSDQAEIISRALDLFGTERFMERGDDEE